MFDLQLENLTLEEQARLEAEWLTINALRDTLDIANKGHSPPTYQETLDFGESLAPEFFARQRSIFRQIQADSAVREYQQLAEAESMLEKRSVTPIEIIDREIDRCRRLLQTPGQRDQLQRRLKYLETIRFKLLQESATESRLLLHDVFFAQRSDLPEVPGGGTAYRAFQLPQGRVLRLRLLHPDRPEQSTGADLLYEVDCPQRREGRMAFVQYKIWDGRVLYSSRAKNLNLQMEKLTDLTCRGGLCSAGHATAPPEEYRLPCCGAFLRPTDKLQKKQLRLISHGTHIPACIAKQLLNRDQAVRRDDIQGRALSSRVFEELFAQGLAGSPWLPYSRIERLYRSHSIFGPNDRIFIHAQEFEHYEEPSILRGKIGSRQKSSGGIANGKGLGGGNVLA